MSPFKRIYGADPLHLLVAVASFALVAYGLSKLFSGAAPLSIAAWFLGAIALHDLVAYPLYTGLDRIAGSGVRAWRMPRTRVPAINHLRIPVAFSGLAFLVYLPDVLALNETRFVKATSLSPDIFLGRWLGLTAVLFAVSAVLYAVRLARAGRQPAEIADVDAAEAAVDG